MEKQKILIVDDEPDIALILKLQLEDAGYETLRARDGVEALDAIQSEDFSLVMLDIKMPRMGGLEVLDRIRGDNIPVVMMTAHGSEDIAVETLRKGALDYISKPFSTNDMLMKVKRAIDMQKAKPLRRAVDALSELGPTKVEDVAVDDFLGRKPYTKALVRLLTVRDDDRPYAIGLFGHWGSGKSSLIAQVKALLNKQSEPKVTFADFNAWSHEHANNIAAALAQSVVDALLEKLGFVEQLWLAIKLAHKRRIKTVEALGRDRLRFLRLLMESWSVWSPAVIAILLILFSIHLFLSSEIGRAISVSVLAIPTAVLAYFGGTLFVYNNLSGWFKKINLGKELHRFYVPNYSSHLGLYHDMRQNLEHLSDLLQHNSSDPNSGEYLFLIVDDLDRCGPETVKQVFDAIRLVAAIPRVVTLVAIDERIAFRAIELYYDSMGHAGREPALVARDYLAKVFQVAINLPQPDSSHIRDYITTKLFGDNQDDDLTEQKQNFTALADGQNQHTLNNTGSDFTGSNENKALMVAGEKELFADLAISYSFSNPRLLWRMMQSWWLLKSLVLKGTYDFQEAEPWLRLLFWREWLFQQEYLYRQTMDDLPFATSQEKIPDQIRGALPRNLEEGEYKQRCIRIDTVLLPAAPKPEKVG